MAWKIEYSREADDYLFDNFPYTESLDWKLIDLLDTDGIPKTGAHQLELGLLMCEIEKHTVVYRRNQTTQTIRILVLKPLE